MNSVLRNIILFSLALFILPFSVKAANDIVIEPAIVSEKTSSPGILEYNIKIKNNVKGKSEVYVIIRDVVAGGERKYNDPSELSMLSSPTRWMEIKRMIEILPEEEIEVPLKINIPSDVEPGFYHAAIIFAKGGNRTEAEEAADNKNEAKLIINLEIEKHEVEKAQVVNFSSGGNLIVDSSVDFTIDIKNIGNKEIIPEGEIVIYDKAGRMVDSVNVVETRETIFPGSNQKYNVSWNSPRKFGRFKAKLMMYYGSDQKDIQDVVTFILVPLPILLVIIILILAIVAFLSYFLLKRNNAEADAYYEEDELIPEDIDMPKEQKLVSDFTPIDQGRFRTPKNAENYTIDLKGRK